MRDEKLKNDGIRETAQNEENSRMRLKVWRMSTANCPKKNSTLSRQKKKYHKNTKQNKDVPGYRN